MHKKEKLMCVIIGFKSPSSPLETIVLLWLMTFSSHIKSKLSLLLNFPTVIILNSLCIKNTTPNQWLLKLSQKTRKTKTDDVSFS